MLKKLVLLLAAIVVSMSATFAVAAVDVNTADQAALESVKGLGPVKSKAIIDERTKNGPFKDASDLANRVKGLGVKSVTNLEAQGLTINGSSTPPQAGGGKAAPATRTPMPAAPVQPAAKPVKPAAAASSMSDTPAPASGARESKSKKHKKSKAGAASAASGA